MPELVRDRESPACRGVGGIYSNQSLVALPVVEPGDVYIFQAFKDQSNAQASSYLLYRDRRLLDVRLLQQLSSLLHDALTT